MDPATAIILRTEAIALRIRPFARTSHVVTWLAPDHGRVTTVIKGACRPKSAFLGQYDLFATCELLFYRRDHEGAHAIRECWPLAPREAVRTHWRRITTASYLCDTVARVAQPGQEAPELYHLLGAALDGLQGRAFDASDILRFELGLLRHLGLSPHLDLCPVCHTEAHPWLRFALASGRARCLHTGPATPDEPAVTVHREVLEHLQRLAAPGASAIRCVCPQPLADRPAACPTVGPAASPVAFCRPVLIRPTACTESQPHLVAPAAAYLSLGSRRFLGIFLRFHLDTPPAPRRLAFELLDTDPALIGASMGESS